LLSPISKTEHMIDLMGRGTLSEAGVPQCSEDSPLTVLMSVDENDLSSV
jgi:hypothetical protein